MNYFRELFKFSLIISVILVALSASYYFTIFMPHKAQVAIDQQKQDKLAKDHEEQVNTAFSKNIECQKYKAQLDKNQEELGFMKMKSVSGIFYSSKTNSCLYVGMDWDDKIKVKDGLSGQMVYEETFFHNQDKKLAGTVGEEIDRLVTAWK